jgi:GNAT superfamily N-acetyltransferase
LVSKITPDRAEQVYTKVSMPGFEILDVNALNVDQLGVPCALNEPGSTGHQEKLEWAKERFSEGLRIKIIQRGGRGYIEYMPGKMAWRGIDAPGYMVIHCLWVAGRAKGKGLGKALLDACMHDARQAGLRGVAVVAASHQDGFVDTEFFLRHGFHVVQSEGGIDLCALKFELAAADPHFAPDLRKKAKALGPELTVVSSPQCPYTYAAAQQVVELAHANHIPARSLRVNSLAQLRHTSPSPYASFDIAYDGEVISHLCRCMTAGKLRKLVKKTSARKP